MEHWRDGHQCRYYTWVCIDVTEGSVAYGEQRDTEDGFEMAELGVNTDLVYMCLDDNSGAWECYTVNTKVLGAFSGLLDLHGRAMVTFEGSLRRTPKPRKTTVGGNNEGSVGT